MVLDTVRFPTVEQRPITSDHPLTKKELRSYRKGFYVDKYGACFKYEIPVHVNKSRILALYGPFRGAMNDIKIYESGLLAVLSPDDRIVADRGYIGTPQVVTMKKGRDHNETEWIINIHRQKGENVYSRFKDFAICTAKWRGSEQEHALMLGVLCKILNMHL